MNQQEFDDILQKGPIPSRGESQQEPLWVIIRRWAGRLTRQDADADDLTQDVIIKLSATISKLRDDKKILSFSKSVLRNERIDQQRTDSKHPLISIADEVQHPVTSKDDPSPINPADRLEKIRERMLAFLKENDRHLSIFKIWWECKLRGGNHFTHQEYEAFASDLGMKKQTLCNQLSLMSHLVRAVANRLPWENNALEEYCDRAHWLYRRPDLILTKIVTVDLSALATNFDCWKTHPLLCLLQERLARLVRDHRSRVLFLRNFIYDTARLTETLSDNCEEILADHLRRGFQVSVVPYRTIIGHPDSESLLADMGNLGGVLAFDYGHFYPIGPDSKVPLYEFITRNEAPRKFADIVRRVEIVQSLAHPLPSARAVEQFIQGLRRRHDAKKKS